MDKASLLQIQKLLDNSDLLLGTKPKKSYPSYDFSKETILVTGAAGSIGSGLVQSLVNSKYKKLILLDNAETPLYYLEKEFSLKQHHSIKFILGDISDKKAMKALFETYRPTLIFHAAAYKHVSLMELHPYEAVKVNINATIYLATLAVQYNARKFIFISTDKAVNPMGVMGMTKNIAENYLTNLVDTNNTVFITARFGNIFGSNGSVVPLFIKQLEQGEDLSLTDSNISRLFIDKDKACDFILQTSMFETSENIKVSFDMGKPIKILDLAKLLIDNYNSIHKCNISPGISITQLQEGEKLVEEMISENEVLIPSKTEEIYLILNKKAKTKTLFDLNKLEAVSPFMEAQKIKVILSTLCQF
ncbi:SDR family NAD(P)-dependent oxidoreductase [Hyunsoonleella sp. SJ7]|uniref:SDR family NAD(P)-dependent oxidoreductase n=1 Tax=Hyunsoonleella aquatilis TaxID=2762758 RepID=A0A923HCM3_9FLAO|nr:SDR family NAD(P)-dependent oxidoreductase [Hyunsoonleella aquatilis]MBC3758969.1 SDR family NAD(P)-dependent oxidoreductase [Hyunsoonleella aquatilis]